MRSFEDILPILNEHLERFNQIIAETKNVDQEHKRVNKEIERKSCLVIGLLWLAIPITIAILIWVFVTQLDHIRLPKFLASADLLFMVLKYAFFGSIGYFIYRQTKAVQPIKKKYNDLQDMFKKEVIEPFLKQVFIHDVTYKSTMTLSEKSTTKLKASGHVSFSNIKSLEDVIQTKIGLVDVIISEVSVNRDGYSKRNSNEHNSLFLVADFHKNFTGTMRLEFGGKNQGAIDEMLDTELVDEMEDETFNNVFSVYGSDKTLNRYILSLSFINRLLELYKRHRCRMDFLFLDSKMYMRLYWFNDMLEYNHKGAKAEIENFKEFYDDVASVKEILEVLNQDTRIWRA